MSGGPLSGKALPALTPGEIANFNKRFDRPDNDCWVWKGHPKRGGYGQFKLRKQFFSAHRVAWELANGPIPEGMVLDHLCNHPPCVRPSHLRVVTMKENYHASPNMNWRRSRSATQ